MHARLPKSRRLARFVGVLLVAAAGAAGAQDEGVTAEAPSALMERATVRLRYGVALRQGGQQDLGPGVTYDGMTQNDVAAGVTFFPSRAFGAFLGAQREAFTLLNGDRTITGGGLLRASVGPMARVVFGPLKLEAQAGYQFAQLPAFDNTMNPQLRPVTRHGVLLASRVAVALPLGIVAEARGEFPLTLQATDAQGARAQAKGFAGGGGLSIPVLSTDSTDWRLGLDYQYVQDEVTTAQGATSSQRISRLGAAFGVDFLPPGVPRAPKVGGVALLVVAEETGKPVQGARLTVGGRTLTLGPDGRAALEGLEPGTVTANVIAEGYLPAQAEAEIAAGRVAPLELRLRKEPPKVGALRVKVTDKQSGQPLAGATITARDASAQTAADGTATLAALPPGNVPLRILAQGYTAGDEVAAIVTGRTSELAVTLVKEKQKVPATISGIIRSIRGGKPVRARLEIPELSLTIRADERGAFSQPVPAGSFRVIISAPGFRQQTKQVTVREGDQTIFNVDLHPRGR